MDRRRRVYAGLTVGRCSCQSQAGKPVDTTRSCRPFTVHRQSYVQFELTAHNQL